jgi:F-type H+-transporting ATPase subunit b
MSFAPLLAAAEASPPLIDIDGTVFVQFAIFVVMMAVLRVLVFKPFFAVQDERHRRIEGARKEALAMEERATAITADYEAKLTEARRRGADERIKLRSEGQAHEREVLAAARARSAKAMEEAMAHARVEEAEARARLAGDAQSIAHEVATRVIGRPI